MSSWQETLSRLMTLATTVAMVAHMDVITMAVVGPRLEKKLERRLTEWDWQTYGQEKANRERCEAMNGLATCFRQQLIDWQIIHDFVWDAENS